MFNTLKRLLNIVTTRHQIYLENRLLFKLLHTSLHLGRRVLENRDTEPVWDVGKPFSIISNIILAKNVHRLQSILILCKRGLAKDAIPLVRVMFEELVDLKYMHADKDRIQKYFQYDTYIRLKLGRTILEHTIVDVDIRRVEKRNIELQSIWDSVKYGFTDKKGKIHKRWTCKNVQQVSKEVGLMNEYHYLFGYLSNYIHSSPITANDYVLGRDEDDVVLTIGTSPEFVPGVLGTATGIFVDMLSLVNSEFTAGLDDDLNFIANALRKDKRAH